MQNLRDVDGVTVVSQLHEGVMCQTCMHTAASHPTKHLSGD